MDYKEKRTQVDLVLKEGVLTVEHVKTIQEHLDSMHAEKVEMFKRMETQTSALDSMTNLATTLTAANSFCTETLKNVFTLLGSRADVFEGDAEMMVLMNTLAEFVLNTSGKPEPRGKHEK